MSTRLGRPGETQKLVNERIDPIDFVADEIGKCLAEIGILITLRQQLRKRLDRNERVLDFVRHAGRKRAEAGETVAAADLQLESFQRGDIGQHHERAEHLPFLAVENRAAGADDDTAIIRMQHELAILLAFTRAQRFPQQIAQANRQLELTSDPARRSSSGR